MIHSKILRYYLNISIILVLMISLAFGCKQKSKSDRMVVIYAGEGSQLDRAGNSSPLKRGMLLGQKDIVITNNKGVVDLQATDGALVRVQKFSRIEIANLGQHTSLKLKQGSLMARVEKRDANQKFEVRSPTLVAGVRGTTFKIGEDGVKVISGKVAVKPRIEALEKKTETEIASDPNLKNLAETIKNQEQVLEAGQNGSISKSTTAKIEHINTTLEKGKQVEAKALTVSADKLEIEDQGISLKEKADEATIVGIDENLLVEITTEDVLKSTDNFETESDTGNSKNDKTLKIISKLEKNYNQKRDQAFDKLEKETLKEVKLVNEADIRKHYEIVESVHLHDGSRVYTGAVLAQAGGILVIHTNKGINRVPVNKVNYIDYK